ncbi:hypothetical protein LZ31DRAFT_568035 [Colletotrichum somersetense]|nr:hypothetical protein LZ31DRAFT_568035 [Colletotrichum somersetense]
MEFAYYGDYSIPRLSKSGQSPEDESQFSESDSDSTDGALALYLRSHGVNIRRKKTKDEINEPSSLHKWMLQPNDASKAWLKDTQQQHRTSYENVFMTHARLYIVANKFHIIELRNLCLLRTRLSLLHAPSTSEVAAAVFQIARVAYDKTNANDPLRDLLIKSVPGFAADLLLEIPQAFWVEIRHGGKAER